MEIRTKRTASSWVHAWDGRRWENGHVGIAHLTELMTVSFSPGGEMRAIYSDTFSGSSPRFGLVLAFHTNKTFDCKLFQIFESEFLFKF